MLEQVIRRPLENDYRAGIVDYALSLVGARSISHPRSRVNHQLGCDPILGFDCSGFAIHVLSRSLGYKLASLENEQESDFCTYGLQVPGITSPIRHASQLFDLFGVTTQNPQAGDLVFFSKHGSAPDHIGFVVDPDTGEIVHAPGKDGTVVTRKILVPSAIPRVTRSQRYLWNPIGFKSPAIPNGRWQIPM